MSEVAGERPVSTPGQEVGAELRQAREQQALSVEDVALRTRIPLRFLHAIEAGVHDGLPSAMYAVGFVRTYAKTVGLDPQSLGERFRREIGYMRAPSSMPEYLEEADPARVPPRWFVMGGLLAALIVALGYWLIRTQTVPNDEEIVQAVAGTAPVASQPAPQVIAPSPAPVEAGPVVLTATADVWLRVYERNGAKLLERELKAGESWQLPTTAVDPLLLTGHPQALTIRVGALLVPPLAKSDVSIKDVSLKPAALLALAQPAPPQLPVALDGTAPQPLPQAVIDPVAKPSRRATAARRSPSVAPAADAAPSGDVGVDSGTNSAAPSGADAAPVAAPMSAH
jgi:hypothetical protein